MDKKLLFSVTIKDCDVQTFCSGGKGGQHQNRTYSGVRIIHRASGAIGESRESRHQIENKRIAFVRMANTSKFKAWIKLETSNRLGKPSVGEIVDKQIIDSNLLVEVKNPQGQWIVSS